ncbi:MAG: hypothetical protein PHQ57_07095 [Candidatus Omnitrophica bacterium]|nr:hypothetical protein [Candidatus Omnitrophota bacterium]
MKSFVFLSRTGCLLPFLIVFNFFFGLFFLKPAYWLIVELVLVLFFAINSYILTKKIFSSSSKRNDVIDTEGEIIDDKHKLK